LRGGLIAVEDERSGANEYLVNAAEGSAKGQRLSAGSPRYESSDGTIEVASRLP
jgi:hypothetical protein